MGRSPTPDDILSKVLVEKAYLTQPQLEACQKAYRDALKTGVRIAFLKFVQDRGHLDDAKVALIREELARRGVHPKLGEYEILGKIGEGGMGTVFKAKHPRLGTEVAIKVLRPEVAENELVVKRFEREGKMASKLHGADIVQVLDVQRAEGKYFIVMEYMDGESVEDRIQREGKLPEIEALRIIRDAARALDHAHKAGIVHRDMKPSNLMLSKAGKVKIADLGLGKDKSAGDSSLTDSGTGMGTPHYVSPEEASDSKHVDHRTDIYSLGASLYHMVTGSTPYEGSSGFKVVLKHLNEPLRDPREVNPALSTETAGLIRQMMEKDPAKRVQNCEAVAQAAERIHRMLEDREALAAPKKLVGMPRKVAVAVGLGAVAVLIAVALWAVFGRKEEKSAVAVAGSPHTAVPTAATAQARPATAPAPVPTTTLATKAEDAKPVAAIPATTPTAAPRPAATPAATKPATFAAPPGTIAPTAPHRTTHYIAVDGVAGNLGTQDSPWNIAALERRADIQPGDTVYLRGGTYRYPDRGYNALAFKIALQGAQDRPIEIRPFGAEHVCIDGKLNVTGDYLWIRDIEITISEPKAVLSGTAASGNEDRGLRPGRMACTLISKMNNGKFINMNIHGAADMAANICTNADGAIEVYGCTFYDNGTRYESRWVGSNLYLLQGDTARHKITIADCLSLGASLKDEQGGILLNLTSSGLGLPNVDIEGNVFANGVVASSPVGAASGNVRIVRNFMPSVWFRLMGSGPTLDLQDNVALVSKLWEIGTFGKKIDQGNMVVTVGGKRPLIVRALLRPNKYDPSRAHLAVLNFQRLKAATVDATTFLRNGERFRLHDPMNLYGPPVHTGVCQSGRITVPMAGEFGVWVMFKDIPAPASAAPPAPAQSTATNP